MSDQAKFWLWIVLLALTCAFLGAVIASVARAQADHAGQSTHPDRLFRAAYVLCGSQADAEDLVRETLARALDRRGRLPPGGDPARLMRVLRRTWIELQRARSCRPAASGSPVATDWVVDRARDNDLTAREVHVAYEAVRDLSPQQREAIAAVDVLELSHRDAARALRIRRRTLTRRLSSARERISAALEETR
jgi:RNA polymerase sigma-70 factor (ECF subfamily)